MSARDIWWDKQLVIAFTTLLNCRRCQRELLWTGGFFGASYTAGDGAHGCGCILLVILVTLEVALLSRMLVDVDVG